MIDIDEIMRRAQRASEEASARLNESMQKSKEIAEKMEQESEERKRNTSPGQVEILGQPFGADDIMQSAPIDEQIRAEVEKQVAEYTSLSADAMLGKLFGDDMGIIAAALETLAEEDDDDDETDFDESTAERLCELLEEEILKVRELSESEPVPVDDDSEKLENFGILLSGIISNLNQHELDSLDVEEHIPIMEQQIATVVRNSWGIRGREGLLDTLTYLTKEGYRLRYSQYAAAATVEDLFADDMDQEDKDSICRGWDFVQRFKDKYPAKFLTGWDLGRSAMLARWGYYLGWITRDEAVGILSDLALMAIEDVGSWRDFGCSYIFGGVFWKIICGAGDGQKYLRSLSSSISELLSADDDEGGQWLKNPWLLPRKVCR